MGFDGQRDGPGALISYMLFLVAYRSECSWFVAGGSFVCCCVSLAMLMFGESWPPAVWAQDRYFASACPVSLAGSLVAILSKALMRDTYRLKPPILHTVPRKERCPRHHLSVFFFCASELKNLSEFFPGVAQVCHPCCRELGLNSSLGQVNLHYLRRCSPLAKDEHMYSLYHYCCLLLSAVNPKQFFSPPSLAIPKCLYPGSDWTIAWVWMGEPGVSCYQAGWVTLLQHEEHPHLRWRCC